MSQHEELAADSSALIYIAKAGAFERVGAIGLTLVAVPGVWHEAVEQGRRAGHVDAARIEVAEEGGLLRRVELLAPQLALSAAVAVQERVGTGESQVIVHCRARGMRALIDDRRAARAARARGVDAFSTLALGVLARRAGLSVATSLGIARALAAAAGATVDVLARYEERIREEHP